MAGPYYVNIDDPGAWNGKAGTNKTTEALLGLSGLQYLIDTVTVGNGPIYVKGATGGDISKLKSLACDNLSGTFTRGEAVTWDGGSSSGVVSELTSNYPSVIEVITGTLANDDNLVGSSSGATADVNGAPTQKTTGIDIDTNAGSNSAGWIKIIGCNDDADYTVDGTRAKIYGGGTPAAAHIIQATGTSDMYWLENIRMSTTAVGTYHGFNASSADSNGFVFINCCADGCGGSGFQTVNTSGTLMWRCVSYSNTVNGFTTPKSIYFSCARDNSTSGITTPSTVFGCISHGNTDDGIGAVPASATIINSVIDANVDDGVVLGTSSSLYGAIIIGCRVTNHTGLSSGTEYGVNFNTEPVIIAHCYFEDNEDNIYDETNALVQFIPIENGSTTTNLEDLALDDGTSDEGYVDKANHDFSTDYQAAHASQVPRRTAITIPWS